MTSAIVSAGTVTRDVRRRFPILSVSVCVVLCTCLAAQIVNPTLLSAAQRDASRIRGGEWYRLLTALFFQDGGLAGGVWNIAILGVLGSLAEQMLNRAHWAGVYAVSGISAELVALDWQPVGAGNSIAVFGLAGAVVVVAWQRASNQSVTISTLLSGVVAALLVCVHDIHGLAFAVGALSAVLAIRVTAVVDDRTIGGKH